MDLIRVFLAGPSRDFTELLRLALERHEDFSVIGEAARGDKAYAQLAECRPDVLVTDLLLPGLDGLSLLRKLKEEGILPHTLVVSGFSNDRMAQALSRIGVEDYFLKPCSMDALTERIREAVSASPRSSVRDSVPAIRSALRELGIPLTLDGHKYLVESIRLALKDHSALHGVTKILYPDIARHFGVSPQCVERSIRGAIAKCWEETTPEERARRLRGVFARFGPEKPGNARFIGILVEYIETDCENADLWKSERP